MAWNQNRNWIRAARAAHGTNSLRFANGAGNFTVTFRFASGDFPQGVPDAFLKFRPCQIQRRKTFRRTPGENLFQRGGGRLMPAADCSWDANGLDGSRGRSPHRWKIQLSQSFFRIMRAKLAVACANRQFYRWRFHSWFTQWLRMKTQMVPNRMTNNMMAKKMKRLRATRFS